MAGTNDILPFALGGAANIMLQPDYASLSARANGFQSGVAQSAQVNKVLRQVAFMSRVLSQWAIDQTGGSILDNGDEANAKSLLTAAVQAIINAILALNNYATNPQLAAAVAGLVSQINNEAALRAQADAAEASARSNQDQSEAAARLLADQGEANQRFANDQAIIAGLAQYMQKNTSRSFHVDILSVPTFTSPQNNLFAQINYSTTVPVFFQVSGVVNVLGNALQPSTADLDLWVDGLLQARVVSTGSMTAFRAFELGAGSHVFQLYYSPVDPSVVYHQILLTLSFIAVQA